MTAAAFAPRTELLCVFRARRTRRHARTEGIYQDENYANHPWTMACKCATYWHPRSVAHKFYLGGGSHRGFEFLTLLREQCNLCERIRPSVVEQRVTFSENRDGGGWWNFWHWKGTRVQGEWYSFWWWDFSEEKSDERGYILLNQASIILIIILHSLNSSIS